MKKNYRLEILYDNGISETFKTGEVTVKTLENVLNIFYKSFQEGVDAVIQVPNGTGYNAYINVSKSN